MKFSPEEIQSLLGLENVWNSQGDDDEEENEGNDMLLSRRMARYFAKRYPSWYGIGADVDQSWAYFERIVLPRRMKVNATEDEKVETIGQNETKRHKQPKRSKYTKAPVGTFDRKTTLYPAWTTSGRDLADFGTGVAVYFETVRMLIAILFIAGLLYIPNFQYYKSDLYDPAQEPPSSGKMITNQLSAIMRGSLICDASEWAPCPNCTLEDWRETPHRIAFSSDHENNNDPLVFVLKNACAPLRWQEGLNHLVVVAFLIVALIALSKYQEKQELKYDEFVLTASDYSIQIDNPPYDAFDPDEWKTFFDQFGSEQQQQQVVYVTVALHNEKLINSLKKRRELLQKFSYKIIGRDDTEPLQCVPQELQEEEPKLYSKLKKVEDKCQALLQKKFDVSAVFVTFDTEYAQRQALESLAVGRVHVASNNKNVLPNPQQHAFRGNLVLDVFESCEPSSIRWHDLDETMFIKLCQRLLSYSITFAIVYAGFITVKNGFERGSSFAAFEIVILNIAVPKLFQLVNYLESHPHETSYQASLYIKICIFRWINTAVITTVVKPLLSTLEASKGALIPSVHQILKAEIMTVPLVHMLDIPGNIKRHILAPHAANQAAMNSFFTGAPCFLGEKYTDVTKIVFLCFFYSVIFPSSFFFGAAALGLTYMTAKFNLLRTWAPVPKLGDDLAKLSRQVFFPLSLLALVIMSEFYWSAYPFDNVCDTDLIISDDFEAFEQYIGNHSLKTAEMMKCSTKKNKPPPAFEVTVDEKKTIYRFCNQDFLERLSALFAFFHEEKNDWMSDDQIALTFIFGLVCVVVVAVFTLYIFWTTILPNIRKVTGEEKYSTTERDSKKKYSDQSHIQAYIPQVKSRSFPHPLFACDVGEVDHRHIGWSDPMRGHAYYAMSEDILFLKKDRQPQTGEKRTPVLSVVRQYKPQSKTTGYGSMDNRSTTTRKRRTIRI